MSPVTIRQQIAKGPRFIVDDDAGQAVCNACPDVGDVDEATGLCRPCWRAWRWSPKREEGVAGTVPPKGFDPHDPKLIAETAERMAVGIERDRAAAQGGR